MFMNLLKKTPSVVLTLLLFTLVIHVDDAKALPVTDGLQSGVLRENSWGIPRGNGLRERGTWIVNYNERTRQQDQNADTVTTIAAIIDAPIKREMFTSQGWGAGGMPFNVLYMKSRKPTKPRLQTLQPIAEPLRAQPPAELMPQPQKQYQNPNGSMNLGEDAPQTSASGGMLVGRNRPKSQSSSSSLFVPSRRHYSIIPQLFVSYGWGSVGK